MTLIKWNNRPSNSFFNNAFNHLLESDFGLLGQNQSGNIPAVNIQEDEQGYHLELAVPGLNKEDIKVRFEDGLLTISAEQKHEVEEKTENYTRREFSYQNFKRSFQLPETANEEGIDAKYEAGVLKLNIPKKAEAQPKRRDITIG